VLTVSAEVSRSRASDDVRVYHLKCFMYGTSPLPALCNTLLAQVHRDLLLTLYNIIMQCEKSMLRL
jgi:hypothetical protein